MLQPLVKRTCPSWCDADHSHQTHPADEMHWGALGTVAATELQMGVDGLESHQCGVQIDVVVEQGIGPGAAYVSLVVDDLRGRSMRITAYDARRLSLVLGLAASAAGA